MLLHIILYYIAAFLQGLCLVIIPAASTIFKQAEQNGISDGQYGLLSLSMILSAVLGTVTFSRWIKALGRRQLYYLALILNALYLLGVTASFYTIGAPLSSFVLLFAASFCLGGGLGFLISLLNVLVVEPFKKRGDAVLTGLHASLGIGAAAAPQLVSFFQQQGLWQGASLAALLLLAVVLVSSLLIGLVPSGSVELASGKGTSGMGASGGRGDASAAGGAVSGVSTADDGITAGMPSMPSMPSMPGAAWLFLVVMLFYGIVEAMIGYWTIDYLTIERGLDISEAAAALSIFWALITVGRILASPLALLLDGWYLYIVSPAAICGSIILLLSADASALLYTYVILGVACSYFFPLSVSLSIRHFPIFTERLSGLSVAALMGGIGVGNFVVGFLRNSGIVSLEQGFQGAAILAAIFAAIVLFLFMRLKKSDQKEPS